MPFHVLKLLLCVAGMLLSFPAGAQLQLTSLRASLGVKGLPKLPGHTANYLEQAPGLQLLQRDRTGFAAIDSGEAGVGMAISVTAELAGSGNTRARWQAGLNYEQMAFTACAFRKFSAKAFDTLQANNGSTLYLDSVYSERYGFSQELHVLTLELGRIYLYGDSSGHGFWWGYGATVGVPLLASITGSYSNDRYVAVLIDSNSVQFPRTVSFHTANQETETVRVRPAGSFSVYVPAGFRAQIPGGPTLFAQGRAGLEVAGNPGVQLYVYPYFNFQLGVGFRLRERS